MENTSDNILYQHTNWTNAFWSVVINGKYIGCFNTENAWALVKEKEAILYIYSTV
jgi:adenine specific DNA methylase Mod